MGMVVCLVVLLSGGCRQVDSPQSRDDVADPVVSVADVDREMNEATEKAKSTVGEFIGYVTNPTPDMEAFFVKKPFKTNSGNREHIWVIVERFEDGFFWGRVDNVPADVPDLKNGDPVKVHPQEISDWMIVQGDGKIGGYTIDVLEARR